MLKSIRFIVCITAFLYAFSVGSAAQNVYTPGVSIINTGIQGLPGVQSFVLGTHNGDWLIIGGRKDGLHQRQPFAAFLASENNTTISVINPETGTVWNHDLASLPVSLQEQLQSTNMEFYQDGSKLIIMGGYGYSATKDEHVTYNGLVIIDIPTCIESVKSKSSLQNALKYVFDDRVQVTGGQLGKLDDYFYLVGGQKFEGRYNPMGPDHGPGFIQKYTNAIRKFKISEINDQVSLTDYTETIDTAELHRRDYNMLQQIFPNGSIGFTVFSGVFQYKADLPWLNAVNITSAGYEVVPDFEQRLNQYHGAKSSLYDPVNKVSYNLFYGGISRFYFDSNNNLTDDLDVPFVKTISLITRDQSGVLEEKSIGNMPAFLGASAEFIPAISMKMIPDTDIMSYDPAKSDSLFIGYIFGGIKSSAEKVFWINDGTQSEASNQIYKVYLHQKASYVKKPELSSLDYFKPIVYPNPAFDNFVVEFNLSKPDEITVELIGQHAEILKTKKNRLQAGNQKIEVPISDIPDGTYFVKLSNGKLVHTLKILK